MRLLNVITATNLNTEIVQEMRLAFRLQKSNGHSTAAGPIPVQFWVHVAHHDRFVTFAVDIWRVRRQYPELMARLEVRVGLVMM